MTWTPERGALYLRRYALRAKAPFLVEDVVRHAQITSDCNPDDLRAWGPAVRMAHKRGWIKSRGVGKAVTSNHSLKPRWVAA